jgi:hypothetical protein
MSERNVPAIAEHLLATWQTLCASPRPTDGQALAGAYPEGMRANLKPRAVAA